MSHRLRLTTTAIAAGALLGCLPTDISPPAEVTIELRASELSAAVPAAKISDGWEIVFNRLLLTVHTVSLVSVNDTGCDSAISGYARIVSLRHAGPQRVALLFASGSCGFSYETSTLAHFFEFVLGSGVTTDDRDAMFAAAPEFLAQARDEELGVWRREEVRGPGLYAEGHATRDGEQKRFEWMFWDVSPVGQSVCPPGSLMGLNLGSDQRVKVELSARGEALFLQAPSVGGLAFNEFADADTVTGNGDGWISQTELRQARRAGEGLALHDRVLARLKSELTSAASDWSCFTPPEF
jgi:hypothetical protein